MFFVIDRPQLQRIIAIMRDDRSPAAQSGNAPFLRLAAVENEFTVSTSAGETTIPATVYEPGVLFLRTTIFRRLLSSLRGENPSSIHVCVAELVPRYADFEQYDRYPDYFSPETYWTTDRLWKFIGIPFEAVTLAIRDAAKEFRNRLIEGLRGLLPEDEPSEDTPLFDTGRRNK